MHRLDRLLVADALEGPAVPFQEALPQQGVTAARVAGAQGEDARARRFDRLRHLRPGLPRPHHRGAALGLDDRDARQPVDQPHLKELAKSLEDAVRTDPAAYRLNVPVRGPPGRTGPG